jgi:glycosyltransferase involved in cell wall biosynthesis
MQRAAEPKMTITTLTDIDCAADPDLTRHYADVVVCVPCYNEGLTIASVIDAFRRHLPGARVVVFDNNSSDDTVVQARSRSALVLSVRLQGKGNVIRRAFADIEAEVYLLVDGDGTYDAAAAPAMVALLRDEQLDMVVGCRHEDGADGGEKYRQGHRFGNWMLTRLLARMFGGQFTDILSGYRVFSRRFVKSFPALARGFETETELTVHALELRMPCGELPTLYGSRPEGSQSKLSTYRDGWRILGMMLRLYMAERPLRFFSGMAAATMALAVLVFLPVLFEYLQTGLVRRFPTAILATGMVIVSLLSAVCGLIQDNITRGRQEAKRLRYLAIPARIDTSVAP